MAVPAAPQRSASSRRAARREPMDDARQQTVARLRHRQSSPEAGGQDLVPTAPTAPSAPSDRMTLVRVAAAVSTTAAT
ncbi:MAG: hypothetical protein U0703_14700 [Anaerolineae bacterium]